MTSIRPLIVSLAVLAFAAPALATPAPAITPVPAKMTVNDGAFVLSNATPIHVPEGDAELLSVAEYLRETLKAQRGLKLKITTAAPKEGQGAIRLTRIQTLVAEDNEAYHLTVASDGVTIGAVSRAGAFYGAVSLWQLATSEAGKGKMELPEVNIFDTPRFKWRGLMIDSARHFQTPADIKTIIDAMASQKLNILQWHLTDDQGWRLHINAYPKLTEVGAWRQPAGAAGFDAMGKPVRYGGFYTQEEAREIVAYAAARNITVVPEIDMPGHATAAITAYPELGSEGAQPKQGMSDWGVYPNLYNVKDETFTFLTTVLDEVMAVFPSPYIHIGGDEAIKPQWEQSPEIQARMKELGLKDEMELQSWFITRIGKHISDKGRRMIGWDEILEGGIAPDATIMSWRGLDGAVAAAKMGHDTVLSPAPDLYLNHRQSLSGDEPPGRGQVVTLKDYYGFNPEPAAIDPEAHKHILGLQANIWTEHARTTERVERQVFPRLTALAEVGWSAADVRSWEGFAKRLPANLHRLDRLGIRYNRTPFDPVPALAASDGAVSVSLSRSLELGQVHFTTNGKEPTAASPIYSAPLTLPVGTKLTTRTFLDGQALGSPKTFMLSQEAIETRTSQQMGTCDNKLVLNLEDDGGERAVVLTDILHPCWLWRGADTSKGLAVTAEVGSMPFNFQLGNHPEAPKVDRPVSEAGELNVHVGTCDGAVVASLPLGDAGKNPGISVLKGKIPATDGTNDLCFSFGQKAPPPQWVVKSIRLTVPGK